jgi:hypothetical protein
MAHINNNNNQDDNDESYTPISFSSRRFEYDNNLHIVRVHLDGSIILDNLDENRKVFSTITIEMDGLKKWLSTQGIEMTYYSLNKTKV